MCLQLGAAAHSACATHDASPHLQLLTRYCMLHRFLSHFRSVHRGAYFAQMRTTTVRKLLPESWGFLCPVHTPDGSPCGLLNHFTADCRVVCEPPSSTAAPCILMVGSDGPPP